MDTVIVQPMGTPLIKIMQEQLGKSNIAIFNSGMSQAGGGGRGGVRPSGFRPRPYCAPPDFWPCPLLLAPPDFQTLRHA